MTASNRLVIESRLSEQEGGLRLALNCQSAEPHAITGAEARSAPVFLSAYHLPKTGKVMVLACRAFSPL